MKLIELDSGRTGLFAIVDDEDFEELSKFKWRSKQESSKSKTIYAVRTKLKHESFKKAGQSMHRQIMCISDKNVQVDHRDQNGLNNQKCNLRICNQAQNNANRQSLHNGTSKFLGVCYYPEYGRKKHWIANISHKNKSIRLGRFLTEIEAAKAYNHKAKEIHGEFANLNNV